MWHPWWALVHRRSLRTGETCARLKALSLIEIDRVSTSSSKASCANVLSLDQSSLIVWFSYRGKM